MRAPGFEPAAGSFGVLVDGPGWTFSFVVGSAGIPAGVDADVPASPELAPSFGAGITVVGFEPGDCGLTPELVSAANAIELNELTAAIARAAAPDFKKFIGISSFL